MIVIPVYNMVILPDISMTFKKDFFDDSTAGSIHEGEKVLFLFKRSDKNRRSLTGKDFYPIGLTGVVEAVDDDGDITVRSEDRMNIGDIIVSDSEIYADAVIRPDIRDVSEEDKKKILETLKVRITEFVQKFPWADGAHLYQPLEECGRMCDCTQCVSDA